MFKNVKNYLTYNLKTLVKFELLYKLITIFIFSPLFTLLFKIIMKINGYKFLTIENILEFAKKPSTIVLIILLLIIMMLYTMYEIVTIILICEASRQKLKVNLKETLSLSLKKSLKLLKISNIGLIFFVLFLIPFLNIGIGVSYISVIKVPEYIKDYIMSNLLYFSLYVLLMIILFITFFRWIYSFNYIIYDNLSFRKAKKKSVLLSRKKHIKDFLKILFTEAIIYLLYIIFVLIGIGLILLIHHYIINKLVLSSLMISIIGIFLGISLILFSLLSVPISFASITYLFIKHKEENEEELIDIDLSSCVIENSKPKKFNLFKYVIIMLLIISGTIYTYNYFKGNLSLNVEYVKNIEVTAHRGASVDFPENTMIAFKKAKEYGADWIELDVQETLDGIIVVSHDSNLKRVTGKNIEINDVNYEEIETLDVSYKFGNKYKNEYIPNLDTVIIWAKDNNMKLNIELKPTGKEVDLEKTVVDIISNYDFENNVVVTSSKYESLKKVKKYNKDIKTIYVLSIAFGDISDLKYADGFSIEASNINRSLIKKIHKSGKEVYAWTVNKEESINKMIKLNVDNIITDDIKEAKELIKESKTSNIIIEYVKLIRNNLS